MEVVSVLRPCSHSIAHGDLFPTNVLISGGGAGDKEEYCVVDWSGAMQTSVAAEADAGRFRAYIYQCILLCNWYACMHVCMQS